MTEEYVHAQNLCIAVAKTMFYSDERKSMVVTEIPICPEDAEKFGLTPVVGVVLGVRGATPFHVEYFSFEGSIELGDFPNFAWCERNIFRGIPDVLFIDKKLESNFPITEVIRPMTPPGKKFEISTHGGQSFGSTKKIIEQVASFVIRGAKKTPASKNVLSA